MGLLEENISLKLMLKDTRFLLCMVSCCMDIDAVFVPDVVGFYSKKRSMWEVGTDKTKNNNWNFCNRYSTFVRFLVNRQLYLK